MKKSYLILPLMFIATGCATTPPVTMSYYPTKADVKVAVTATVACNSAKTKLVTSASSTITPSYSADYSEGPYHFDTKDINGGIFSSWEDVSFSPAFYSDMRLKSINQSATGQASNVATSVASLVTTGVAAFTGIRLMARNPASTTGSEDNTLTKACAIINTQAGGAEKSATLQYSLNLDLYKTTTQEVIPSTQTKQILDDLKKTGENVNIPTYFTTIINAKNIQQPIQSNDIKSPQITLQKMKSIQINVSTDNSDKNVINSTKTLVPTNETYTIPIPKAALFGTQTFNISLAESGAITSFTYSNSSGAADAIGAANTAASTPANAVEAQADLIYQLNRLTTCKADSSSCTSN